MTIDFRDFDARERGSKPVPEAIPFDITPDDPLVAAIKVHTDALRPRDKEPTP
jgi:hypothetical protein